MPKPILDNSILRKPAQSIEMNDFPGLQLNSDPHDIDPGAAVIQTNVQCLRSGELRVRGGTVPLKFDP